MKTTVEYSTQSQSPCVTFGRMNALDLLLPALGIALFLEGLPWFISPRATRQAAEQMASMRDLPLRVVGLFLMAGGLLLAWWTVG